MKKKQMLFLSRYVQSGRSMVEMLGVLVIMAVLSITAIMGFKYAMDKTKANTLLNDAKLAYVDFAQRAVPNVPTGWEEVTSFEPETPYTLYTLRDEEEDNFVLAEDVPLGVCERLLDMETENTLVFFDEYGYDFLECGDLNDIVFSFSGFGIGASCETNADCGEGFNGYCDTEYGVCRPCEEDTAINAAGDKCVPTCNGSTELSCTYRTYGWCCPATMICNPNPDLDMPLEEACLPTGGACSCDFTAPTTTIESDCSCDFTAPTTTIAADCAYEFSLSADGTASFKLAEGYSACGTGKYCYLKYSNDTCGTSASATHTGILYGACTDLSLVNQGCPVTTSSTQPFSNCSGCSGGKYCYLKYTNKECSSSAAATTGSTKTEKLYGACTDLALVNQGCPITTSSTQPFSNCSGCPDGQYCYLKYSAYDYSVSKGQFVCTNASATHNAKLYGSCLALPSVSVFCPQEED